jgi:hypothetical protein
MVTWYGTAAADVSASVEILQHVEQRHGAITGPTQHGLLTGIGKRLQAIGAMTPDQAAAVTYAAREEYR